MNKCIEVFFYYLQFATKRDMDDKGKDPNFNISQFLQNSYKHPDFLDEKPIEETKEIVKTIQQNVTKKKFRPLIQRNEKVDSAIDIPNMVQKLQTYISIKSVIYQHLSNNHINVDECN